MPEFQLRVRGPAGAFAPGQTPEAGAGPGLLRARAIGQATAGIAGAVGKAAAKIEARETAVELAELGPQLQGLANRALNFDDLDDEAVTGPKAIEALKAERLEMLDAGVEEVLGGDFTDSTKEQLRASVASVRSQVAERLNENLQKRAVVALDNRADAAARALLEAAEDGDPDDVDAAEEDARALLRQRPNTSEEDISRFIGPIARRVKAGATRRRDEARVEKGERARAGARTLIEDAEPEDLDDAVRQASEDLAGSTEMSEEDITKFTRPIADRTRRTQDRARQVELIERENQTRSEVRTLIQNAKTIEEAESAADTGRDMLRGIPELPEEAVTQFVDPLLRRARSEAIRAGLTSPDTAVAMETTRRVLNDPLASAGERALAQNTFRQMLNQRNAKTTGSAASTGSTYEDMSDLEKALTINVTKLEADRAILDTDVAQKTLSKEEIAARKSSIDATELQAAEAAMNAANGLGIEQGIPGAINLGPGDKATRESRELAFESLWLPLLRDDVSVLSIPGVPNLLSIEQKADILLGSGVRAGWSTESAGNYIAQLQASTNIEDLQLLGVFVRRLRESDRRGLLIPSNRKQSDTLIQGTVSAMGETQLAFATHFDNLVRTNGKFDATGNITNGEALAKTVIDIHSTAIPSQRMKTYDSAIAAEDGTAAKDVGSAPNLKHLTSVLGPTLFIFGGTNVIGAMPEVYEDLVEFYYQRGSPIGSARQTALTQLRVRFQETGMTTQGMMEDSPEAVYGAPTEVLIRSLEVDLKELFPLLTKQSVRDFNRSIPEDFPWMGGVYSFVLNGINSTQLSGQGPLERESGGVLGTGARPFSNIKLQAIEHPTEGKVFLVSHIDPARPAEFTPMLDKNNMPVMWSFDADAYRKQFLKERRSNEEVIRGLRPSRAIQTPETGLRPIEVIPIPEDRHFKGDPEFPIAPARLDPGFRDIKQIEGGLGNAPR